jgi:hypothetical protein
MAPRDRRDRSLLPHSRLSRPDNNNNNNNNNNNLEITVSHSWTRKMCVSRLSGWTQCLVTLKFLTARGLSASVRGLCPTEWNYAAVIRDDLTSETFSVSCVCVCGGGGGGSMGCRQCSSLNVPFFMYRDYDNAEPFFYTQALMRLGDNFWTVRLTHPSLISCFTTGSIRFCDFEPFDRGSLQGFHAHKNCTDKKIKTLWQ